MMLKFSVLLDMIFPHDARCSLCGSERDMGGGLGICKPCAAGLDRLSYVDYVDGMECLCAYKYGDEMKRMVRSLKFYGKRHYARTLGILAAQCMAEHGWEADALVPVPLHYKREKERGYNQSRLIADAISEETGIPVKPWILTRVKETLPQSELTAVQRHANVLDAFSATIDDANSILLVDDVLTTGSTFRECCLAMANTGLDYRALAIARV